MALGVLLGAFGSHGLKNVISDHYLDVYKTGNLYHFIHSLGLLITVSILAKKGLTEEAKKSFLFFLIGIILFSGSLYILSIAEWVGLPQLKIAGAITPIGGIFFVLAWLYSAVVIVRRA